MTENTIKTNDIRIFADQFLNESCKIAPLDASEMGFAQYDDRIGDLSPATDEALYDLAKKTLNEIPNFELGDHYQKLCADVLSDRCTEIIEEYETNDWVRGINVITNPLDTIHATCYNIDESDVKSVEKRKQKISTIPDALESYRETLLYGVENVCLPRRTQLTHLADNARLYSKDKLFLDTPAQKAFIDLGTFIDENIVSHSDENDYVGEEIYSRFAARHIGKTINIEETYDWGWNEIRSILSEINTLTDQINPGGTYLETMDQLNNDPNFQAKSPNELQHFLQNLLDESITQLDGIHFDIDPRLKSIEACLLDEAGSSAMYYSAPSDDFSRPGRTYYPINNKKVFSLWEEVTTCYHEGLPGHHLHLGAIKCLGDELSTFQKTAAYNAGFGEGWALYAERLMVELGFNSRPEHIYGMLNASLFRAVRIVMDIGLHCQLVIPDDAPDLFPHGEKWSTPLAIDVLQNVIGMNKHFSTDEVHRYLGWIGQAISYKVGEKTIRDIRASQEELLRENFSLKDFHTKVLSCGHVGLGRLEQLFLKV